MKILNLHLLETLPYDNGLYKETIIYHIMGRGGEFIVKLTIVLEKAVMNIVFRQMI